MLSAQVQETNKISCLDSEYYFQEELEYKTVRVVINSKVTVTCCKVGRSCIKKLSISDCEAVIAALK